MEAGLHDEAVEAGLDAVIAQVDEWDAMEAARQEGLGQ
jgi:hypothetical protein